MSEELKEIEKKIDEVLTKNYATRPDGKAWCTRHVHSLDLGICLSCEASKELLELFEEYAKEIIGEDEEATTEEEGWLVNRKLDRSRLRAEQRKRLESHKKDT